jgi:5-methylthioadenosine/S-adenosylhomocysteine deaminase
MCIFCRSSNPSRLNTSRRGLLKGIAGLGALGAVAYLTNSSTAMAQTASLPRQTGAQGVRYVIRGGSVLSMDAAVGDFAVADVLVEGKKILAVAPHIDAGDAAVIDAAGRIVMPGFIDTHHHQFETALRSFLANGLLADNGVEDGSVNYMDYILGRFAGVYRPDDVYISELFGSLSQLDAGVTTVHDVSQIHHSPAHSDAAIHGIADSGRRAAFGYFEGQGTDTRYPEDVRRIKDSYFSSKDQLMTLVMGGEVYLPNFEHAWALGRELDLPIAAHVVGGAIDLPFERMAKEGKLGPDNLFIHMTNLDDAAWKIAADAGVGLSCAVPIEMTMRHGTPPLLQALSMGMNPSLSTDVECTMSADFFTQMRSAMTLQRGLVNQAAIDGKNDLPKLLTDRDVIEFATVNGAKALWLEDKVGTLTPGKEADILLLDGNALNVAPVNSVPGAVVTLMDRTNVETVIVAGKIRKWQGQLLDADIDGLRTKLVASRDYLFEAAHIEQNVFRN